MVSWTRRDERNSTLSAGKYLMKMFHVLVVVVAAAAQAFGSPAGVLEKATKVKVDPTVVEHPDKVDDSMAPNLARFDLRAAVRDAHLEEGESPLRAHIVLDQFSSESPARRLVGLGSGRSICTVEGKLVIQDADGKELASVKFHLHGTVAFSAGAATDAQGRHAASDFEQLLLKDLEGLK
jgi:hypothetical protein